MTLPERDPERCCQRTFGDGLRIAKRLAAPIAMGLAGRATLVSTGRDGIDPHVSPVAERMSESVATIGHVADCDRWR